MSLSQTLQQKFLQKLSPQQIQLMKLLQVPTANLEERIKEELEENPALEQGQEDDGDEFIDELKEYLKEHNYIRTEIAEPQVNFNKEQTSVYLSYPIEKPEKYIQKHNVNVLINKISTDENKRMEPATNITLMS
jgi:DNA-directed RNA polymerase specialized sigma54-like protein